MENINFDSLITNLYTLLPQVEQAIHDEQNLIKEPAMILKPAEQEFTLDDIDQQHGQSCMLYAFLGIEQLIEFLIFQLITFKHLSNPSFFRLYFKSEKEDLCQIDKEILIEHYVSTMKRCFILNLSTIFESNIRRIVDYRMNDKPKTKAQDFAEYCKKHDIAKETENKLTKNFFSSSFIELHKYLKLLPKLTKDQKAATEYIQILRNSTHNGGYYIGKNRTLTYRKLQITFTHSHPSELLGANIYFLLEDVFHIFTSLRNEFSIPSSS